MVASPTLMANAPEVPLTTLRQAWPRASAPRPVVVIGAGSIVRDAHLPVYQGLGLEVAGIYDLDATAAHARAAAFRIPRVFASLAEAVKTPDAILDVAIPPAAIAAVLEQIPAGTYVLIQKPMGRDLVEAQRILAICRDRMLRAAFNFQLCFAPTCSRSRTCSKADG